MTFRTFKIRRNKKCAVCGDAPTIRELVRPRLVVPLHAGAGSRGGAMSAAIAALALTSVLEAIGHTPLVRLHLAGIPNAVQLWAKCEWLNPGGSVKDRTARSLIVEGERRGALRPAATIIDSSSGNHRRGPGPRRPCEGLRGRAGDARQRERRSAPSVRAYGAHLYADSAFDGARRRAPRR